MTNAITQYLNLYDAHRDLIDQGAPRTLNRLRPAAAQLLRSSRLPDTHTEGFEKTSINDLFLPDYGVNINRIDLPVDPAATFRCDVPNISTLMAIVANDSFVPTESLLRNLPKGVEILSLARAAELYPDLIEANYGSIAPLTDPAVALNTLLAQDGVFIHIHPGVKLAKPIQIVNIFNTAAPILAPRRILIVAEADSAADILVCDHSRRDNVKYLASQIAEIHLHPHARLQYLDLEETSPDTGRYSQIFVRQETGSQFHATAATLLNGTTRNDYNITIAGPGTDTRLHGMAIGDNNQHIDNSSVITHDAPHSTSNQLFRYVLDGHASGAFEGSIQVTPNAPHTQAYQSNNNILASPHARMHTKPQLLIYNDDVKCSHGASTGQLNNEALFYMQTRGIPVAEARTMLMQAFLVDIINAVSIPGVADRLRHLVAKRFDGTLGSCPTCHPH